ncbi:MAG: type II toxin-antitoxin system HipA family toxin [Planctomycetia bacterium]|nr:type II toxin-antitoxin system HipA family toxin [Planctomycetia bacterium]
MNRCPITYQSISKSKYSSAGLKILHPKLTSLSDIPYTAKEQRIESRKRATKMSIQGFQAKLSARLRVSNSCFDIVDTNGTYILKPQSDTYEQLPENEDLTMKLAKIIGIEKPLSGMVYSKDGSLTYFIKRFDRYGRNKKYRLEDFAQLTGNTRETKYNWSIEKLVPVIENYCTFPVIEKIILFRLIVFSFITGNEDMHLKNFSIIERDKIIKLSPAYDLLNTTIAITNPIEEIALPIKGKKRNLKKSDLVQYFAIYRLGINKNSINNVLEKIYYNLHILHEIIDKSFLSASFKEQYHHLLEKRSNKIFT